MTSKIPQSSALAFKIIREIIEMGEVDIPPIFNGSGAPGDTLEYLCDIERNNFDSPDLHDWEVKFHGGASLLTLFHKDPYPKGIIDKMIDAFGWETSKGNISFRHTIKGKSERGFLVENRDNKIIVSNKMDSNIEPYWENNIILNSIAAKLRRLILVHGKVNRIKRKVIYKSANAYWDLDMQNICDAIKEGVIYIDFDARTNGGRGTSIRNHGTKFRIKIKDIGVIYDNSILII